MAHSKSLQRGHDWQWNILQKCPDELAHIVSALNQTRDYIKRSVKGLEYDILWTRVNNNIPAMGNILMHLRGTEHQWIGNRVGNIPLKRTRDLEFSTKNGDELPLLIKQLDETEKETTSVLEQLEDINEEALFCFHYTENHLAFHAGQLCTLRKIHEPRFALYE